MVARGKCQDLQGSCGLCDKSYRWLQLLSRAPWTLFWLFSAAMHGRIHGMEDEARSCSEPSTTPSISCIQTAGAS